MNIHLSRNGLTLMEITVSTAIVAIMMIGIGSAQRALQSNSQNYGLNYVAGTDAVNTLDNILNNASLAIGSGNPADANYRFNDKGILVPNDMGGGNPTFCIHQDVNTPPTPSNTADDRWMCYTQIGNSIYSCTMAYGGGGGVRGAVPCTGAGADRLVTNKFTGTFGATNPTFAPVNAMGGQTLQFTISITSRVRPTAAVDNLNNPQFTKSGSVSPANHSM